MEVGKTILIVEDDKDLQALLASFLKRSGCKVMSLFDGPIQNVLQKNALPDVILLDMDLPHSNGVEIGQELKADPSTHDIPVIMLSANADIDQLSKLAGAIDYLQKPFMANDVLVKILKYIRGGFQKKEGRASA